MNRQLGFLALGCIALCLVACSKDKDNDNTAKPPESPEKLYSDARSKMDEKSYKDAISGFEEVDKQYPYSKWANNAEIMSAYASYKNEDYDTAVATLERYVKLYPDNDSTPYAYYLIALCYYDQISDVGRDQKITEKALAALREVVRRFPDSEYAHDAKIKEDLTVDHLAGKEMQVGRYYLRHDDYIAAINRFRSVVENYQTTTHVPEALHRLVECYLRLGVPAEAQRYAAVLGYNFPNSIWYRDSYKLMGKYGLATPPQQPSENPEAIAPAPDAMPATPAKKTSWWHFW